MVDTPDSIPSEDRRSNRRNFLIRLVFLSLGIWSVCTLVCGVILSVLCIQRGQPNYTVLAIVLTSLGMTGVVTSLPCCLYFCLAPSQQSDPCLENISGLETPSIVSDIFIHLSTNRGSNGWGSAPSLSSPVLFGVFRPTASPSARQTLGTQSPPPYDPPPCYEDATSAARLILPLPIAPQNHENHHR